MRNATAYVIAAWGGARRVADGPYEKDPSIYLRYHLAQLEGLDHKLDLIVVAIPRNDGQDGRFFDYCHHAIPESIVRADGHETKVRVLWRDNNRGLAFGSFEDAFLAYRDEVRWWFWFEDDYVPLRPHFDHEMKAIFHTSLDASFVAARINPKDTMGMPHAIISIGLTTTEKIDAVREAHGGLVYLKEDTTDYRPHESFMSQRKFTHTFYDAGRLYDVTGKFQVGLRLKRGKLTWYGSGPKLIGPIQALERWNSKSAIYPTPKDYR